MFKWLERLTNIFSQTASTPPKPEKVILPVQEIITLFSPMGKISDKNDIFTALDNLKHWIDIGVDNPSHPDLINFKQALNELTYAAENGLLGLFDPENATISISPELLPKLAKNAHFIDQAGVALKDKDIANMSAENQDNVVSIFQKLEDAVGDHPAEGETWDSMGDKLFKIADNFAMLFHQYGLTPYDEPPPFAPSNKGPKIP